MDYLSEKVLRIIMKLTAADRSSLLVLAASLPKGDTDRRVILAGLKKAAEKPDPKKKWDLYIEFPGKPKHLVKKDVTLVEAQKWQNRANKLYGAIPANDKALAKHMNLDEKDLKGGSEGATWITDGEQTWVNDGPDDDSWGRNDGYVD